MVLEEYRQRLHPYIARLARPLLGWPPAAISAVALVAAIAAGGLAAGTRWLGPVGFLPVALLVLLSGVFDVLDGEVARATGRASRRGDFVDHVFDRYADLAILLGIAASGFVNPLLALVALVSLLLTSYMGTQAQAVGQGRLYSGLLTRADRLVVLAAATFLEFDWTLPWPWAPNEPWSQFAVYGVRFTVLDVAMLYFVIAGQWTAIARAIRVYRALPSSESGPPPPPAGP